MSRLPKFYLTAVTLLLASGITLHAADGSDPAVARMRDALKTASTQLASAQSELTTAQTALAESDARAKSAEARVAVLTKQAIADRVDSDKVLSAINAKTSAALVQIESLNVSLKKLKESYDSKVKAAQLESTENDRLKAEVIVLERRISNLEAKNITLIELSDEILTRYKEFSLGEALKAKEPFVGTTRVKLENLAQDYKYKIRDQRANP
ncbi:MAG: hypothetical protein WCO38_01340 [Verrucomicrobiota bacterium]|nr:MAG: hypothetical protein DVB35_01765 [Verrucomicrobiota bacterium]